MQSVDVSQWWCGVAMLWGSAGILAAGIHGLALLLALGIALVTPTLLPLPALSSSL